MAEHKSTLEAHLSNLRETQEAEEANQKALMRSQSLWEGIEGASKSTAEHVKGMTLSMLKWTGLFSGLGALAGYFSLAGITGLGTDVYGWRKSSMGLGVTSGQERAFNIAFGPLLGNSGGFLSGISAAVSDLSNQTALYSLGVNPNQSTSQVAVDTLKAIRRIALATPVNQLGIAEGIYGLGQFGVSAEDLRRFKKMSQSDFSGMLGIYGSAQRNLALNERTQLAWTRFIQSMDTAKGEIENVFVRGLVPLTGPIERLASGFAHLLGVVMRKDGPISKDIDAVAKWMNQWTGEIAKPQFLTDIERFIKGIHKIASAFGFADNPVGAMTGAAIGGSLAGAPGAAAGAVIGATSGDIYSMYSAAQWRKRFLAHPTLQAWDALAAQFDRDMGLPPGTLENLKRRESGMGLSAGPLGIMGLMSGTAAQWGVNPNDPLQSMYGAGMQLRMLVARYGSVRAALAAYDSSQSALATSAPGTLASYLSGSAASEGLPGAASQSDIMQAVRYLVAELKTVLTKTPSVTVKNAPGSNAVAAVSQVGASR